MNWEPVIGLEVHAQLKTKSKIFSGSSTQYGAPPNTQASAIDLGLPGVLPVLNREAVMMAIKFGLAVQANIAHYSVFARKNYFYPDLPKGYQISQYELPIVSNGYLEIDTNAGRKRIGITRAHLEEDAGKSLHEDFHGMTGIDLNRAGTPLLEIVSDPDLRSAAEAAAYMKTLHRLVCYLDICDGNLQEGSFRCDANVSMRRCGEQRLGVRTEIKNVNSFRFIEKAINYEIERQIAILESGGAVVQETRLYDAERDETRPMRGKEAANDYRYFPDPDLLPISVSESMIQAIRQTLPELPQQKSLRFHEQYALENAEIESLLADKALADYFETVVQAAQCKPKLALNWISGELAAALNKSQKRITQSPVSAEQLGRLLTRIEDQTLSGKTAKTVFDALWQGEGDVDSIINRKGLQQVSDTTALEKIIQQILAENPGQVEQYKAGKTKVFSFFVGQVMKATAGKANPQRINQLLMEMLRAL